MPKLMDRIISFDQNNDGNKAESVPVNHMSNNSTAPTTTTGSTMDPAKSDGTLADQCEYDRRKMIKTEHCRRSASTSRGKHLNIPAREHDSPTSTVVQEVAGFESLFFNQQQLQLSDLIKVGKDGLDNLKEAIDYLDGITPFMPHNDGCKIYTVSSKKLVSKANQLLRIVSSNLEAFRSADENEVLDTNDSDRERMVRVIQQCIYKVMKLIVAVTNTTKKLGQRSKFIKNNMSEHGFYHAGGSQHAKIQNQVNRILDEMEVENQMELRNAEFSKMKKAGDCARSVKDEETAERNEAVDSSYARLLADQYSLLTELRNNPKASDVF